MGSVVVAHRLRCPEADPPGSGIEPVSPALDAGFFITGKPLLNFINIHILKVSW